MSHLCDHTNGARGGPRQARINVMIDPQSSRGLMATIAEIDAASDEAMLRAAVKRAQQAVVAELGGHTPTPTLAAAWSEAMRTTVATTARLVATAAAGASPATLDMVRLRQCRARRGRPGLGCGDAGRVGRRRRRRGQDPCPDAGRRGARAAGGVRTAAGRQRCAGQPASVLPPRRQLGRRHRTLGGPARPGPRRGDAGPAGRCLERHRGRAPGTVATARPRRRRATSDRAQVDAAGRHLRCGRPSRRDCASSPPRWTGPTSSRR